MTKSSPAQWISAGLLSAIVLLGTIQLSDIKQSIDRNRENIVAVQELAIAVQQGFAVQQQILVTNAEVDADQEGRLRILERWRDTVNRQGGLQ